MADETLVWRNLVADWHLRQGMPDCGCDDETADDQFCPTSRDWADKHMPVPTDDELDGKTDVWNHQVWVAAWGRNAPLIASPTDFRIPIPPSGVSWLLTRMLIRGVKVIELALIRLTEDDMLTVSRSRVRADPDKVADQAHNMLRDLQNPAD